MTTQEARPLFYESQAARSAEWYPGEFEVLTRREYELLVWYHERTCKYARDKQDTRNKV